MDAFDVLGHDRQARDAQKQRVVAEIVVHQTEAMHTHALHQTSRNV